MSHRFSIARFIRLMIGVSATCWLLLFARVSPVAAHAVLVSASPAPNEIARSAPAEVRIRFSEPVVPAFSRIQVFNQSGQQIDNDDLVTANANNTSLAVTLPPLAGGTYLVSWEVLSTVDGHSSNGSFPFAVGVAELSDLSGDAVPVTQWPTPLSAASRWLTLIGTGLLLGLFTFLLLVWRPAYAALESSETEIDFNHAQQRLSLKFARLTLALLGIGLLFTFLNQATRFNLFTLENGTAWLHTRFGSMWLIRLSLTFFVAVSLPFWKRDIQQEKGSITRRSWQWWLWGLVLAIGISLTTSLISHSAALPFDTTTATLVDFGHMLAAGVWVGGLIQLVTTLWRLRQLPDQPRAWLNLSLTLNFSAVAAGAVGILIISGGYLAWKHIGSWVALFGTAYGLTLLGKMALALPAFGIAGVNLLFIKPRLEATFIRQDMDAASQVYHRLRRLVRLEAIFAVLILIVAGFLTDLQRGQEAPLLGQESGQITLVQTADDLNVTLTMNPARIGPNQFDIYLRDANGRFVTDAGEILLRFTFLGRAVGSSEVIATLQEDGHYRAQGSYLGLVGPWQVETTIRRPGQFDAFAPYRLEMGLSGSIRSVDAPASAPERLVLFLSRSSGLVTGLFLVVLAVGWEMMALRAAGREWQLAPLLMPGVILFLIGGAQLAAFYRDFTPAMFASNPVLPDAVSISQGEALYAANCAVCHGDEGRGDGPSAVGLSVPPADFTAGHTTNHMDGDLYYWIKEGIDDTPMPGFAARLNDQDLWHLVNYVRRLSTQQT